MRRSSLLALAAASMLAVGGCAGGSAGSPKPGPTLEGRTFLSTAVEGRALVAGTTVRVSFAGGSISVGAGCNSMGGTYRVEGGRLNVGALSMTEMACDQPLMAQDAWLANLLTDGPEITLDGDSLILAGGGVRLGLVDREVTDPDRPLTGIRWVLDGIVSGDTVSSVPVGVTAAITIANGRVEVEAGCNTGGGPVEVADGTLTFASIGLTKMLCLPAVMAVERAMTAVLSGEVSYRIEAAVLTLDVGGRGLIFRAGE